VFSRLSKPRASPGRSHPRYSAGSVSAGGTKGTNGAASPAPSAGRATAKSFSVATSGTGAKGAV
jgi:hypothetical protein